MAFPEKIHTLEQPGTHQETLVSPLNGHSSRHLHADETVLSSIDELCVTHGNVELGTETLQWTASFSQRRLAYDGLTVFLSGLGATNETSRSVQDALAIEGYPTLTFTPPRASNGSRSLRAQDVQAIHAEAIGAVTENFRRQRTLRKAMPFAERIDLDKETLVAHSMSSLSASRYAVDADRVERIIHAMAVGFGSPTVPDLLKRYPQNIKNTLLKELIPGARNRHIQLSSRYILDMLLHSAASPNQTLREALSCVQEDIRPQQQDLRKKGIRIGYIAGQHDSVVPPHPDVTEHVDVYELIPNFGHIAPQCKPVKMAKVIDRIGKDLDTLPSPE